MLHDKVPLRISSIQVKNFRCFDSLNLTFDKSIVLVEGDNGVGKTSLLEALYYACYLRSFRTGSPRELIRFGSDTFFVKLAMHNTQNDHALTHNIQAGFSKGKRLVKVDQKTVSSYKELMQYYRIISLTENDLSLVQGAPQTRRTFIDQVLLLEDPDYISHMRVYRQVLAQRNALLQQYRIDQNTYTVLTEQLWEKSRNIQKKRMAALVILQNKITEIIEVHFQGKLGLTFEYRAKKGEYEQREDFLVANDTLFADEQRFKRTLFGAHLDDFIIKYQDTSSRHYASRGQQKLIILLLKVAQAQHIAQKHGPSVFFLDDFMTDFDTNRAISLVKILNTLENQLIFTSPVRSGALWKHLQDYNAQTINLTN